MNVKDPVVIYPENEVIIKRLKALSFFLDNKLEVPGTNFRFGFDALIGLIPVFGDAIGALLSIYIIFHAAKLGVRIKTLTKMFINLSLDSILGMIPIFGDLFDIGYKSNQKNLQLALNDLESEILKPRSDNHIFKAFLLFLGIMLLVLISGTIYLTTSLLKFIF